MLHNLIRNADEANDESTVSLRISTSEGDTGGRRILELELLDDGPGFPAAVLEQPFEPYVTGKGKGRGLGLAICRKIVYEHDGVITIENRAGGGARIVIRLPLA
jgi:nitrogen fixation/metabolism regulation signal transduction histidine kinase